MKTNEKVFTIAYPCETLQSSRPLAPPTQLRPNLGFGSSPDFHTWCCECDYLWQNVLNNSVSLYEVVTFVDLISSSVSTRSAPMLSNWDFRPAMSSLRLGSSYFSVVSYMETVVKMFCLVITHYLPIPDNINSLHPHCLCYLNHCLTHLKSFVT